MSERTKIGTSNTALDHRWALPVTNVALGESSYDFTGGIGVLESSYQYLAVPESIHTEINAQFSDLGFICPSSSQTCASTDSCDAVAGTLPTLYFTFNDTDGVAYELNVTAAVYLFQDNAQCTTLIETNTEAEVDFVLGDPFFRNSSVQLDFSTAQITLWYKFVDTPIIADDWPEPDVTRIFDNPMNVSEKLIYTGNISVGIEQIDQLLQSSDNIYYDTRSTPTIIPSVSSPYGWFNDTEYSDYIETTSNYTISIGTWEGVCNAMQVSACISGVGVNNTDAVCVPTLDMCLLNDQDGFANDDISGVLGLGRPTSDVQSGQSDCFA